ncbi:Uncharacterised protein [Amycolatopsis camponoti]|uniref:Uncharacterized protein n=1 Tax=Amycolatopsis camponoti TaxID=2606593 RepID=A0A6I8M048_9PSEU|nr:Uncharacterised protein [Amycolatopsis camponoti]
MIDAVSAPVAISSNPRSACGSSGSVFPSNTISSRLSRSATSITVSAFSDCRPRLRLVLGLAPSASTGHR